MNWRKWKIGLAIAATTGALTGVLGFRAGMTWKAALLFLLGTTAKDLVLYLTTHPYDKAIDADASGAQNEQPHL